MRGARGICVVLAVLLAVVPWGAGSLVGSRLISEKLASEFTTELTQSRAETGASGCSETPCKNGGLCLDGLCYCANPFIGPSCQFEIKQEQTVEYAVFYTVLFVCFLAGLLFWLFKHIHDQIINEDRAKHEINKNAFDEQWVQNK